MTISLTKEEVNLIKNWIYIEHENGCLDETMKTVSDLEEKIKMTEMKESLKKIAKRLNKINIFEEND